MAVVYLHVALLLWRASLSESRRLWSHAINVSLKFFQSNIVSSNVYHRINQR